MTTTQAVEAAGNIVTPPTALNRIGAREWPVDVALETPPWNLPELAIAWHAQRKLLLFLLMLMLRK